MIIDFHTHTFPDSVAAKIIPSLCQEFNVPASTDGTLLGLQKSMKAADIDYSVVLPVATSPLSVPKINDAAVSLNVSSQSTGLISFGTMHPDSPDWEYELNRISQLGIRGIKVHPLDQNTDIDDPRYLQIIKYAAQLGLLTVIHCGYDMRYPGLDRSTPEMLLRLLSRCDPTRIILAHMGGWKNWEHVGKVLPGTGAYVDVSVSLGSFKRLNQKGPNGQSIVAMNDESFVDLVRAFDINRVLFGTDTPWGCQREYLARFSALPLTAEENTAILYKNASRLLFANT